MKLIAVFAFLIPAIYGAIMGVAVCSGMLPGWSAVMISGVIIFGLFWGGPELMAQIEKEFDDI